MARIVAVIPCYNEGVNPAAIAASIIAEPGIEIVFVDDASDDESRRTLEELSSHPNVTVLRNAARSGKSASVRRGFESLPADVSKVMVVDGDIILPSASVRAVIDELDRVDLVAANPLVLRDERRSWPARGALFSANLTTRMRSHFFDRYPARYTNGRLVGMSRRLVDAVLEMTLPPQAEDAHIALVCLARGMTCAYRDDAVLYVRAPSSLSDYAAQAIRFGDAGRTLTECWSKSELAKYFYLRARDVASAFVAEAVKAPLAALAFCSMFGVTRIASMQRREATDYRFWPIATSTKLPAARR